MGTDINDILKILPDISKKVESLREMFIANAVMFGEIPSPTFGEGGRVRFLQDRFIEAGCQNISTDEVGNAVGILPGKVGDDCIQISAHLDTPFTMGVDHTVKVNPDYLEGPGILDNSVGVAAVASLASILSALDIEFNSNLLLLGSSHSLGRGDIEGMRFFLKENHLPIRAGIVIEGGEIGRLSYSTLGMLRGSIDCQLPSNYKFSRYGRGGAIPVMNTIVSRILEIPLPSKPATTIILGSLEGGTSYNTAAMRSTLRFEIRSEKTELVEGLKAQIQEIIDETASSTGTKIRLQPAAVRQAGGLPYGHPLVKTARKVFNALDIEAQLTPSTGELAGLIENDIPGITIGLSKGDFRHEFNEQVAIEPLYTGMAQLIGILMAIDEGFCDVKN